ncbi:MAG: hypothetical protein ACODAE_08970 [Gemmatimonadota bacterium]
MRTPIRSLAALLVLSTAVPFGACAGGESAEGGVDRDTLTRRQKDSIIGESGLPGAGAVRRALDASDEAADRAATVDSLTRP